MPFFNAPVHLSGLRTLTRLPSVERGLVLRTLLLVGLIRAALWLIPVRQVRRLMRQCEFLPFSVPASLPVPRLVWAVRAASRRIPRASCLTQSLALQFLLMRTGRSSQLHIGVKNDPRTGFQAHAWVESAGGTLLNTPEELAGYSLMTALEDRSA